MGSEGNLTVEGGERHGRLVVDGARLPVPGVGRGGQHRDGLDGADGAGSGDHDGGGVDLRHHRVADHHGVAGHAATKYIIIYYIFYILLYNLLYYYHHKMT